MDPLLTRSAAAVATALLLCSGAARADLFSPGELSKAHAHLEGLKNCTQCHPAGGELSPESCLACHTELKDALAKNRGFHGRLPESDQQKCESCHHEHQGRDAPLIEWDPSKAQFAHARTGWPLTGKHVQVGCEDCHQPRRISDAKLRTLLEKRRATYLGLPTRCASCHFDEHRGQLGAECEKCHETKGWAPAPGFDHAKTDFTLTGRHQKVPCAKCHEPQPDTRTPADAFPAPRSKTFVTFGDVAHGSCQDCHADPHDGRFGADCASCHTTAGWTSVSATRSDRAFHDKTRYPLKGHHADVACKSCHGPFPGQKARFKGLPFGSCTDCHLDAHGGQLTAGKRVRPCEDCHSVEGFTPPRFAPPEHAKTRYPLEGAHQAVACSACHRDDPALRTRVASAAVQRLKRQGRPLRLSLAKFELAGPFDRCDTCHADPHQGQFTRGANARTCAQCHVVRSFHEVAFDHARDTSFPLTGKHQSATCASCHGSGASVRHRGTPTACAACHADVHARQFAKAATSGARPQTDCARCHDTTAFTPSRFVHAPPGTAFTLDGKHATLPCEACHFTVAVNGAKVRRYRPLPATCEGCHEDFHRGAFARFVSATQGAAARPKTAGGTPCAVCHTVGGFRPAKFDHQRSGFPLLGRHAEVTCRACHTRDLESPLPRDCAGCHRDPHRGELGARCEGCHAEDRGWRSAFDAEAHRRTNFPLIGRHGALPCTECHATTADRRFSGAPVSCVACHLRDYDRTAGTAVDHAALRFPLDCRQCHDGWRFQGAQLAAHEACFSLRGEHAGIGCTQCHSSVPPVASFTTCASMTAACTQCHEHACARTDGDHRDVPGYQCKDRKCYECHRFSGAR